MFHLFYFLISATGPDVLLRSFLQMWSCGNMQLETWGSRALMASPIGICQHERAEAASQPWLWPGLSLTSTVFLLHSQEVHVTYILGYIWDVWDILGEFGFVRRTSADTAGAHEMPEGSLPSVWPCLQNKL